jgi:hypothetical protein
VSSRPCSTSIILLLKVLHFHVEITKFVAHLKQAVSLEALMELKKNIL